MENDDLASMVGSLNALQRSMLLAVAKSTAPLNHFKIRGIFKLSMTQLIFELQPLILGRFVEMIGPEGNESFVIHPDIDSPQLIDLLRE